MLTPGSSSSSDTGSNVSTRPTTAPSSPKLDGNVGLPSPFYPPSLAQIEGIDGKDDAPPLPDYYPPVPASISPKETDAQTKGTPDEWVIRDSALVRLTAELLPLIDPCLRHAQGFLTPTRLFYVRNHGIVPKVTRDEAANWSLEVSGLVKNPCTLSLADLIDPSKFQTVTLPVTLVCAGNRRGEQNAVRKSLGFTWGAAGLSTALFTGVYLADVLNVVQPQNEGVVGQEGFRRAEHVVFEGAEDLPNGKYGTSQRLRWARQKEKGMLLAWAMNGKALEPDHGFPLRLVVPGQIGGTPLRQVAQEDRDQRQGEPAPPALLGAFRRSCSSKQPLTLVLHPQDNKVLPTTLMPEQARNERDWWYDPRYIITDLNVNSAIARPAHNEKLVVPSLSAGTPSTTYTVEGYVYAGGGRRVTRVELTLDDGETWTLCELNYPEDRYRTMPYQGSVWGEIDLASRDECFCWAFWRCQIPVEKLADSGCIAVRGMDESLNLQGKTMYWNPTGMMNNWWFRVAVHRSTDTAGNTVLTFEHPTLPGLQSGGWMDRLKESGLDPANPSFTKAVPEDAEIVARAKQAAVAEKPKIVMTKEGVDRKITSAELMAHNKEEEPWFVVNGEVYDGTGFLKDHPGGAESITLVAGEDASEDFMAIHSLAAKLRLAEFHIGTLVAGEDGPVLTGEAVSSVPDPTFLSKTKWKSAKLVEISYVNHDSRLYRFALEHPEQPLGLPTGQHVYARLRRKMSPEDAEHRGEDKVPVEGELVQRAYTPVSMSNAKGFLDLLIKVRPFFYFLFHATKRKLTSFPLSQVYFRTPAFPEGGKMTLGFEELQVGDVVEFKGPLGSFEWLGITPIIQVLRGVIYDKEDTSTKLYVLNANKTQADILLRAELEALATLAGPERFRQHLVLSKGPEDWPFSKGRINKQMLAEHLPPPGQDSLVLICGPDPMINEIVKPGLTELGWDVPNQLVVF
ncbi:SPOSA6832_04325, partial [Sporobolomyces salmonicolor]